ncbi:MAG: transporter substrate-binding domain-containing protein [Gammaproteobacteria bacterium]|nr:transporter substrate-binding domain-containing protein [Gammaproteobacteria bacterium]
MFLFFVVTSYAVTNDNTDNIEFSDKEQKWLQEQSEIHFSIISSQEPLVFKNQNGQIEGLFPDYIKIIEKKINKKIRISDLVNNPVAVKKRAKELNLHGIFSIFKTPVNDKLYRYTHAYFNTPLYIFTSRKQRQAINNTSALQNKRLAVLNGHQMMNLYANEIQDINIVSASSPRQQMEMLQYGEVDAILGYITYHHQIRKYLFDDIVPSFTAETEHPVHMGILPEYPELLSIMNKAIADIPKSTIDKLIEKWIGITEIKDKNDSVKLNLTAAEQAWIKKRPQVIVGGEMDWAPFDFVNVSGNYEGIANDYLALIETISGLKFKVETGKNWIELLEAIKLRQIDMLPSLYYAKERENYLTYTTPYLTLPEFLFTKNDSKRYNQLSKLNGQTISLVEGFEVVSWVKTNYPDIKVITSPNILDALRKVMTGEAEAYIGDNPSTSYVLQNNFIDSIILNAPIVERNPIKVYAAVRSDMPLLHSIIDKSIKSMTHEQHKLIRDKWFGTYQHDIKNQVKEHSVKILEIFQIEEILFVSGLLILFAFTAFYTYHNSNLLHISLQKFTIGIIIFELTVAVFLIYEIIVFDRLENALANAHKERYEMYKVTDLLRQSSDDLTRFARNFAATGDKAFKNNFDDVLAIRNGEKSRPVKYFGIYWDLDKQMRELLHVDGEAKSIDSLIKQLPFTNEELAKLLLSKTNSDDLVKLEQRAFKEIEQGQLDNATAILHSDQYYNAKQKIMLPIHELLVMLNDRTEIQIKTLKDNVLMYFYLIMLVGTLFIVGNILIFILIRIKVNKPVLFLTGAIESFQSNKPIIEKQSYYNDEIGYMIQEFFSMRQSILEHNKELEASKNKFEELHRHTRESIEYASFIQQALIPSNDIFNTYFSDYFTMWNPKDIVGGDIYLVSELRNDEVLIMVIDCTGHGVPGAFVTMLVKSIERQLVSRIINSDEIVSPAKILSIFNKSMKHLLKQDNQEAISNAGFDGGVLYYNKHQNYIKYSGAETPLFYFQDNELKMIKGNRHSIGYKKSDNNYQFTEHTIEITSQLQLYITSDGYLDQNGGDKDFPFGKNRFKALLKEAHNNKMEKQKEFLLNELEKYQGDSERNDDITVVAFTVEKNLTKLQEKIEILNYHGVISQNFLETCVDNLKLNIEDTKILNQLKSIIIELCRNIMSHAKTKKEGSREIEPVGFIEVLRLQDDLYQITSDNIISIDDKRIIETELKHILSLDKESIRKRYRELRKINQEESAGMGLYEIAKLAKTIDYNIEPINADKYKFSFSLSI